MSFLRTLAACTGIALLVGCSHPDQATAASGPAQASAAAADTASAIVDPCKLLTEDEASAALGTRTGPGQLKPFGKLTTRCSFSTPDNDELFLDVSNPGLFDAAAHIGATSVPGIGDKALWQHDDYSSFLFIEKGNSMISMGLPRTITSPTPAVLKAGKLIASRM